MKTMKRMILAGVAVLTLVVGSTVGLAASQYSSAAEVTAAVTGREVQSVIEERTQTGKTYGAIANEAGALERFKEEVMKMRKEALAARVAAGTITQERADALIVRIEANQQNCDGTGACGGMGTGSFGQGRGQQGGRGGGNGLRDGLCLNQ